MHQARTHLDDGDLAAEASKSLRELDPDVAPADDDEVARKCIEVKQCGVGEEGNVLYARHIRHNGATTDVEEDLGSANHGIADAHLRGRFKARMAGEDCAVLHAAQPTLDAVA